MKKLFTLLIAVVAGIGSANAYKVCVDGIWYELYNGNIAYVVSPDRHDSDYKEYEGDIVIPASFDYGYGDFQKTYNVKSIDYQAFKNYRKITSVTLPDGLTSIGQEAFYGCVNLKSINIPSGVTLIKMWAFQECYSLTSLSIPSSVTTIQDNAFSGVPNIEYSGYATGSPWGARSRNGYVEDYWVYSDESKTKLVVCSAAAEGEVTVPSSVTEIGGSAFAYCAKITSLHVHNDVAIFGSNCFSNIFNVIYNGTADLSKCGAKSVNGYVDGWFVYGDAEKTQLRGCFCSAIGDIEVPNSVTSMNEGTFLGCADITSLILPNGVTRLGRFSGCISLTSIYIPASVTSVVDWSFSGCNKLREVHISDLAAWCNIKYEVGNDTPLSKARHLFLNGEEVTDLVIPSTVTKIEADVFKGCEGLISVTIPDNVVTIGNHAFSDCYGLLSVNMGNGVQTIEKYAFSYCSKLSDCTIGQNVTTIGEYAFDHGYGLKTITIPSKVTTIGNSAFSACDSLKTVFVYAINPPDIRSYTFRTSTNPVFYVPTESVEKYQTAANWKNLNIKGFCSVEKQVTSTSAVLEFSHNLWALDNHYIASVVIKDAEPVDGNRLELTGLEPNTEYKDTTVVLTSNTGEVETINISFQTSALTLETKESKAVSSSVAILMAETNTADIETNCGFEWKPNDAPEDYTGPLVQCPVANGVMAGRLKGLQSTVFYKYRAYYKSAAGKMYYGDWKYIYTGAGTVEFEPIIYTYEATGVKEDEATLKGCAIAGAEDFTEQGFEYWADSRVPQANNAPARVLAELGEHKTVQATGIKMQVTLTDLDAGTVYKYRTYAKVGDQVCYGSEMSFTTQGVYEDEEGIDLIPASLDGTSRKILHNGQILILRGDKVYTVTGQRL